MSDTPTLTTDRFTLRPLRAGDEAALFPTLSDPAQCLYLSRPEFASQEELWAWLAEPGWPGRTWIAEDAQGRVAGRFVAVPGHEEGVVEIGYITCMHAQGEGVARECTGALVAHLFAEGARKLIAEVDAENTPSIRLLERLGFTREALFREHETTHAGLRDVAIYGLLASDPAPSK
ncbi:GNAT family N-acetyltransferase [Qipengyuania sp. 6B39]|uniref:GNAT family N-acetyltransferase n=1 Tax=Qipengyuania proteolytica TaxID=2867239 RepID=UPI001C898E1F|nr:GNAT family protein [Qipengyuania proteolytica]MBX7496524.1 GNAT family N-acetyltransferase [Qipengyuania proteolytica]